MTECPERMLCAADPWRDAVLAVARDHQAGVLTGWPDRWSARTVAGVRYVLSESDACGERLMEQG